MMERETQEARSLLSVLGHTEGAGVRDKAGQLLREKKNEAMVVTIGACDLSKWRGEHPKGRGQQAQGRHEKKKIN